MNCSSCNAAYAAVDAEKHVCHPQATPPDGTEFRRRYTASFVYVEQVRLSDGVVIRHTKEPVISGAP